MPYYRKKINYRRAPPRRRAPIPRRTQQIRKMYGNKPMTSIERYARYAGAIGSIARTVSGMAGLINSEPKFLDNSVAGSLNNTPNYSVSLNQVAQGDTENDRNGNRVLDKSIAGRLHLQATSASATQTCGLALIMVKEDYGSPVWTDVYSNANSFAPINMDNSEKYIVIKRWTITFSPGVKVATNLKIFTNLKGIHTQWDATSSTSIEKGRLCLIGTSDTADNVNVTGIIRFTFYDN